MNKVIMALLLFLSLTSHTYADIQIDNDNFFTPTTNIKELHETSGDKRIVVFFDSQEEPLRPHSLKALESISKDISFLNYVRKHFIIIRIIIEDDSSQLVDINGNTSNPRSVAESLRVTAIPTFIHIDQTGSMRRYMGFKNITELKILFEYWHNETYKQHKSFYKYLKLKDK